MEIGGHPAVIEAPRRGGRAVGAFSHLGALLISPIPLASLLLPVAVWVRDEVSHSGANGSRKSGGEPAVRFVSHHSRESFRFQLLALLSLALLTCCFAVVEGGALAVPVGFALVVWLVTYVVLTLRAALAAWRGESRTYPWPGPDAAVVPAD